MKLLITLILFCSFLFTGCMSGSIAVLNNDYVGHQFNAWNNTNSGVNGLSNIIDTKENPHISIMTITSDRTDLSVLVSEDCVNFVLCEDLTTKINAPTGYTAHIFFTAGARCYQLRSSNDVIINATIIAKN